MGKRVPKSIAVGSTVAVGSAVAASTICIIGTLGVMCQPLIDSVDLIRSESAKSAMGKIPAIPLRLCASVVVAGAVGATALVAVPLVTVGSTAWYLADGTDVTDLETWKYIGDSLDLN